MISLIRNEKYKWEKKMESQKLGEVSEGFLSIQEDAIIPESEHIFELNVEAIRPDL